MKTFTVVKVFIVNDRGELLAVRRSQSDDRRPGELDFPGGWVDDDEDVLAAIKRETKEEVGLDIADPALVFGMSEVTEHGSGTWMVYIAHVNGIPDVTLSFEHDEYRWIKPQMLLEEIKYDRQRKMLTYVIDNALLDKPA